MTLGIEGLLKPHGGRYHENMTFEEEEELLNEFRGCLHNENVV